MQSSVTEVTKGIGGVIDANLPSAEEDRRDAMFRLARGLKALPRYRRAPAAQAEPAFRVWHEKALPSIERKDYANNWAEFQHMWRTVKYHAAHVSLARIVELADATPLPSPFPGFTSSWRRRLLVVCRLLQAQSGTRAFFLDSRSIGNRLGVSHVAVANALRRFVQDGVLRLVAKGRRHRASKYRYIGHQQQTIDEEAA